MYIVLINLNQTPGKLNNVLVSTSYTSGLSKSNIEYIKLFNFFFEFDWG